MTAPAPPTRRTTAERRAEDRRALLDWAEHLMLRHGFHAASMEEIAAGAGLTRGAIYSMFGGKAQLLVAVIERRWRVSATGVATTETERPAATAEEELREFARTFAADLADPRSRDLLALEQEAIAVASRDADVRQALLPLSNRVAQHLTSRLTGALDGDGRPLGPLHSERIAGMAAAMLRGLAWANWFADQRLTADDFAEAAAALLGVPPPSP